MYGRKGYISPAAIRKSVTQQASAPMRQVSPRKLPSFWQAVRFGFITSWAFKPFDFALDGFEQVLYVTFMILDPNNKAQPLATPCDFAVIFHAQPDKLGVMLNTKDVSVSKYVASGSLYGDPIFSGGAGGVFDNTAS